MCDIIVHLLFIPQITCMYVKELYIFITVMFLLFKTRKLQGTVLHCNNYYQNCNDLIIMILNILMKAGEEHRLNIVQNPYHKTRY